MDTQQLDRDREFAIVDSTEEFETPETTPSDDFQAEVSDFEDSSDDTNSTTDYEGTETGINPSSELNHDQDFSVSEPSNQDFSSPEPQEKTPSQQSFRVMRFEDFVNNSGN